MRWLGTDRCPVRPGHLRDVLVRRDHEVIDEADCVLAFGASLNEFTTEFRERGVIRRTTVEIDPVAVGHGVLAFVLIESREWMGDGPTRDALEAIPEIEESHVIAGRASTMVKVRARTTKDLQGTLRRIFEINGASRTATIMVLETTIDRPVNP